MLPYTHWMRPDPDGEMRRANEAQAAVLYQRFRRIGRLTRTAFGLLWRLGAAPLKLAHRWRLQTWTTRDLGRIDRHTRADIELPDGALDDLAERMEAQGVPLASLPPARVGRAVLPIARWNAPRRHMSSVPARQAGLARCSV
ncbi:hypothetical protein [Pararhodobacter sp. SW119]|uniref:hypothetical protein n=1 Tax=Pararhodobacter sp. SW119 TaxID=2780075 RepID=UPI001ADF2D00|nr:hypothetical protein [Pararhodobacter sp. SW119]